MSILIDQGCAVPIEEVALRGARDVSTVSDMVNSGLYDDLDRFKMIESIAYYDRMNQVHKRILSDEELALHIEKAGKLQDIPLDLVEALLVDVLGLSRFDEATVAELAEPFLSQLDSVAAATLTVAGTYSMDVARLFQAHGFV